MDPILQTLWTFFPWLLGYQYTPVLFVTDTISLTIVLSNGYADPAGIGLAKVILINDSFIGPPLRLHAGQTVDFTVINNMAEDTAMHFHGISQSDTPWADGVPGLTQAPILPGQTYTYRWKADEPGVYFYHAHRRGQIQDGVLGAIVITPPDDFQRPFHLISVDTEEIALMRRAERNVVPLLVSDWTQFSYDRVSELQSAANIDFNCFDAIIVNGVGAQYCPSREELDSMTDSELKQMLADEGFPQGLTNKGCVPPITPFQGDFDRNLSALTPEVYDVCSVGSHPAANYSVKVSAEDRWVALTFINSAGLYPLKVTIDSHEMWVYAVDGRYIYPVLVDQITVTNGAKLSVLIRLNQEPAQYTIRVSTAMMGQVLSGYASLDYDGHEEVTTPSAFGMDYAGRPLRHLRTWSDDMAKPWPPIKPARYANRTFKLDLHKLGRPHGAWEWTLSGAQGYNTSLEDPQPPLLSLASSRLPKSDLFLHTLKNEWVDIVIIVRSASATHPQSMPHPMHKHGNKFFVLGSGGGEFPFHNISEAESALPSGTFNFEDPSYRDSFYTPSHPVNVTWIVIRYQATQPGAWLLHCHIQTHLSGGMAVVLLDGVDEWPGDRKGGEEHGQQRGTWAGSLLTKTARMLWEGLRRWF